MKKIVKIPYQKTRVHRVLFESNSPFRGRTVENKRQFKRQPKHRKQEAA
jgi:hypothetical protein